MCILRQTLLLLLVLLLCGCQTLSEKKQGAALSDTLGRYEAALRWSGVEQAQHFHPDGPSAQTGDTADLRIMGYEVIQGPTMLSEDQALQTVIIQYIFESSQMLKELKDQQIWEYDRDEQSWSLQSPFPVFR